MPDVIDDTKGNQENSLGSVDGGMEELENALNKGTADDAGAADGGKTDDGKGGADDTGKGATDDKGTGDDKGGKKDDGAGAVEGDQGKGDPDTRDEEIQSLRQLAREQKRQLENVATKLEETNKRLQDANLISAEDLEAQKEADRLYSERSAQLDNLLEFMRINPKYEDVDSVVSQQHFDDMVEAMAKVVERDHGGKISEIEKGIRQEIWSMGNPYKFMYDQIKLYHPEYAKSEVAKADAGAGKGGDAGTDKGKGKEAGDDKGKEDKKDDLSAKNIIQSIHDLPGADGGAITWTKEMIDDLPELDLDKVPKKVYEAYLRNQLK